MCMCTCCPYLLPCAINFFANWQLYCKTGNTGVQENSMKSWDSQKNSRRWIFNYSLENGPICNLKPTRKALDFCNPQICKMFMQVNWLQPRFVKFSCRLNVLFYSTLHSCMTTNGQDEFIRQHLYWRMRSHVHYPPKGFFSHPYCVDNLSWSALNCSVLHVPNWNNRQYIVVIRPAVLRGIETLSFVILSSMLNDGFSTFGFLLPYYSEIILNRRINWDLMPF